MFFLYQIILSLLIIISPLIILTRIIKNKEDKKRFLEKFCFFSKKKIKKNLIWFHCASVGEVMSVIPLLENYEKKKSIDQILVTTSTLSSSRIIEKLKFKKIIHQFYPLDHYVFVAKFLKYWKPSLAIFVESEIWPCMFKKLKKNNIPLVLLNARITKKTFNRWILIRRFAYLIFNKIHLAYPQNIESKSFLKKLNVKKIKYIGNLKFAENNKVKKNNFNKKLKIQFKNRKIWVASSTHINEELFCAKAHFELKKKVKNLLTIIIPRHVHRVEEIIAQLKKLNLKVALHSRKNYSLKNIDIYIVDTFGETKKFHEIGSSVFLGGSIIKRGGQNPLEAARFGAKIFHGSNTDNFKDVYKLLKNLKISKKVATPRELASSILFKKNKNAGVKIKNIGRIILKKTIKELDYLINNEFNKT